MLLRRKAYHVAGPMAQSKCYDQGPDVNVLVGWLTRAKKVNRSIFTFILSIRKNKYQIYSYSTSNRDHFKTICIYKNLRIFAYFFKIREDFSRLLKKSNILKYISTSQTRT